MNEDRFEEVYRFLVNETEVSSTLTNRSKNETLRLLLELFEYMKDNQDENPIEEYFNDF